MVGIYGFQLRLESYESYRSVGDDSYNGSQEGLTCDIRLLLRKAPIQVLLFRFNFADTCIDSNESGVLAKFECSDDLLARNIIAFARDECDALGIVSEVAFSNSAGAMEAEHHLLAIHYKYERSIKFLFH